MVSGEIVISGICVLGLSVAKLFELADIGITIFDYSSRTAPKKKYFFTRIEARPCDENIVAFSKVTQFSHK